MKKLFSKIKTQYRPITSFSDIRNEIRRWNIIITAAEVTNCDSIWLPGHFIGLEASDRQNYKNFKDMERIILTIIVSILY
ncbi:hypothetical protein RCL_jg12828.t1 [Rhizophagus clarus]|uniref:Uncharacterized protein n=1 Tax=Rhizophagus clarus TaxID=94130 RepID=A0A8H3QCL1_9GLOM|nr:hypothetical protein RCL_jg12828.t1 [Rhizophagus clarus]